MRLAKLFIPTVCFSRQCTSRRFCTPPFHLSISRFISIKAKYYNNTINNGKTHRKSETGSFSRHLRFPIYFQLRNSIIALTRSAPFSSKVLYVSLSLCVHACVADKVNYFIIETIKSFLYRVFVQKLIEKLQLMGLLM